MQIRGIYMEEFLDKIDNRKFFLFKALEESYRNRLTYSELMEALNVSEFVLMRILNDLEDDLQKFDLTESFNIIKYKKYVQLEEKLDVNSEILLHKLVINSPKFKMIDCILKKEFSGVSIFSEENYVNMPKAYSYIKEIKKLFIRTRIKINAKFELVGNEMDQRMFMFNFYYSIFGNIDTPFHRNISEEAELLTAQFKMECYPRLSIIQTNKLLYLFSIILIRQKNGEYIDSEMTVRDYLREEDYQMYSLFFRSKFIEIDDKEINFFIAFLISENIINSDENVIKYNQQSINTTELFLSRFVERFGKFEDFRLKRKIEEGLNHAHFKVSLINRTKYFRDEFIVFPFIKEQYGEILQFCDEFVESCRRTPSLKIVYLNKEFLLNEYIYLIINSMPASFFMKEINVCVDFLLGKNYNEMIIKNIKTFEFLNIEIQENLDLKTDLLLTDSLMKNELTCDYIIWNTPPTTQDWGNLGELLVKIKKKKEMKR
ncbi:hypothetical protein IV74_GL000821 [Carnobacterium divergens DSM 20623]|uniref:Mga helix-turn-helix domain-containing protein n=4 Tax=Carnobacterium divergens TaxID=2748 RepID=A0A0R2HWJ6_CARDV|nr:hypothetical protein IV74_GL000821 [Carnobacterium divergens DSM 20623]